MGEMETLVAPEEDRAAEICIDTPALVDWLIRCAAPTFALYAGYPNEAYAMVDLPTFTADVLSRRTRPGTIKVFDGFNERVDNLWMETHNARVRQGAALEDVSPFESFSRTLTVQAGNAGRWACRPSWAGWHAYRTVRSCARFMAAADGHDSSRLALAVNITDYQVLQASHPSVEVLERMEELKEIIPGIAVMIDYSSAATQVADSGEVMRP